MSKYWVKRLCGHEEQIEIFGKVTEREFKIKQEEKKVCRYCYETEKYSNYEEIEMSYAEYKKYYSYCKTKTGSYDKKNKTIIVYVPKEYQFNTDTINGRIDAIKKVANETELPYEALENIFFNLDTDQYLKYIEENAEILRTSPDKTGKYKNAYMASLNLVRAAKKYGL